MDLTNFWYSSGAAGGGGGGGFDIGNSLRFRGAQSLSRVFAQNNSLTNTISMWFKRGELSTTQTVICLDNGGNNIPFNLQADDEIRVYPGSGGGTIMDTTAVFRDPSAWYHYCINSTTMWINGEVVLTGDMFGNYTATDDVFIGTYGINNMEFFDGYLADVYLISGQDLQPTAFGRENDNGIWVPRAIDFNGTYGTNGFHLDFADPDDLGADRSGNGNDFTATGFNTDPVGIFSNDLTATDDGTVIEPTMAFTDNGTSTSTDPGGIGIVFTPDPAISCTTFGVQHQEQNMTVSINGGDAQPCVGANGEWTDFNVPGGEVTSVEVNITSSSDVQWCRTRLNGAGVLVNNTGTDYDLMQDSPTQNYATLNPISANLGAAPQDANLTVGVTTTNPPSTIAMPRNSGQYYFEAGPLNVTNTSTGRGIGLLGPNRAITSAGIFNAAVGNWAAYTSNATNLALMDGTNGTGTTIGISIFNTGEILRIAYNSDTGEAWLGVDGIWFDAALDHTDVGTNPTWTGIDMEVFGTAYVDTTGQPLPINYGQKPFVYTPPAGYERWQTQNLPEPTILNGRDHFDVITYAGNNDQQREIDGLDFAPGLVWIKQRDGSSTHSLQDTVRGAGANSLRPDTSNAEGVGAAANGFIDRFDDDGFRLNRGTDPGGRVNSNGANYVAWCWRAGGAAEANGDGSIASQVSANTAAGFSIVSYTGNSTAGATVGHGLGATPDFFILKNRDSDNTNWVVWHSALPNPGEDYLRLNTTSGTIQDAFGKWGNGEPDANIITLGPDLDVNRDDMIAYCWHSVPGYSAFDSYTGNGDDDGVFIHLGFRPTFFLWKRTDGDPASWGMIDSTRNLSNPLGSQLFPNENSGESDFTICDFLSNGVKMRNNFRDTNQGNIVYAAFAENPFGGENTAPANAR